MDDKYLGTSADLSVDSSLDDDTILTAWREWASTCGKHGTPVIMQLNHPGRQCPIGAGKHGIFTKNLAPSPLGLRMGAGFVPAAVSKLAFGVPREMRGDEIESIVEKFSRAASLAAKAGFKGVEIHASHGYLVDQFLSSKTNLRKDVYGGNASRRAKLAVDIVHAIRATTPDGFCIGILLSAADDGSRSEKSEEFEQLSTIIEAGVDYVHISGGTFERPAVSRCAAPMDPSKIFTDHRIRCFSDLSRSNRAEVYTLAIRWHLIFSTMQPKSRQVIHSYQFSLPADFAVVTTLKMPFHRPNATRWELQDPQPWNRTYQKLSFSTIKSRAARHLSTRPASRRLG